MKLGSATQRQRGTGARPEAPAVPGFRTIERLEGSEEQWSAEGPGGFKAVLRVLRPASDTDISALQSLLSARPLRHPNVQAVFASWQVGQSVVVAAELPDGTLWDQFRRAVDEGKTGLERVALLEALGEAARALDFINRSSADSTPALPHGDIAPWTILTIGGGVKVSDPDPLRKIPEPGETPRWPAFPVYSAPELLAAAPAISSDQYSLAATYAHLRSGRVLALPDLSSLELVERPVVARALDPDPAKRWPACVAFVEALKACQLDAIEPPRSGPPSTPHGRKVVGAVGSPVAGAVGSSVPTSRTVIGRTTAITLAAATGAVTIAGSLLLRLGVGQASPDRGPVDLDRLIQSADGSLSPGLLARRDHALPRVRLQDPGPEPVATVEPAADQPPVSVPDASHEKAAPVSQAEETPPGGADDVLPVDPFEETDQVQVAPKSTSEAAEFRDEESGPKVPPAASITPTPPKPADLQAPAPPRVNDEPPPAAPAEAELARLAARRRADQALAGRQYDAAVRGYTEAIKADPSDSLAFQGRGLACYHLGRFDEARADLDEAIRLKPGSASARNNRGLTWLASGDPAKAEADFTEAIRLDPEYAVVRYNRGQARAEAGRIAEALADYDAAIRLDPTFPKAFRARAALRTRLADRVGARADYEAVLKLSPSDTAARNNLGLLLAAAGDHHRAIAEFDEAIRINPRYVIARYNRGRVYHELGDLTEALASFDQALALDPNLQSAREARTEVLELASRKEAEGTRNGLGAATRSPSRPINTPTPGITARSGR